LTIVVVAVFSVPCLRRARRNYGRIVNDCSQTTGEMTLVIFHMT